MSGYEAKVKIYTTVAELPSAAFEGQVAVAQDDNFVRHFDGTAWKPVGKSVVKAALEARDTDSTMTADDELVMPLLASTLYSFRVVCHFNTQATPDFKCDMNYTGTVTAYREFALYLVPGTTTPVATTPNTTVGTDTVVAGGSAGAGWVIIEGAIDANAAGTLQFRWAQNTSDAGITQVREGSSLVVYRE